MGLLDDDLPLIGSAVDEQHEEGEEEEDAVHDAEGEAGLEQRAVLVDVDVEAIERHAADLAQRDIQARGLGDGAAALVGDEAQLVHGGDQGTDEAEINQGHEERVALCAAVAEEGVDAPCCAEDRDDEQDEDECWSEDVMGSVEVDEVG